MIITVSSGRSFDTDKDLSAPERHILQKLFAWETMARSLEEFREKKAEALQKGWNDSGAITEGAAFRLIVNDMEKRVKTRLNSS